MISNAGISLVVAPSSLVAKRVMLEAAVPELQGLPWLQTPDAHEASDVSWREPGLDRDLDEGDVALLQYTSGSTSSPRGVMITHANLLDNLARGERLARCDADTIGVSWLPVNHDMGLIGGVLQPAFTGFPVWLMSPVAFLQRPVRWLQAISRVRATHSAAPNFAYELCARKVSDTDRRGLDLSTWRVAYNGSEPVRRSTLEAFQRAFGECGFRFEAFHPAYGLAESTLLVTIASADGPVMLEVDRDALRLGRSVPPSPGAGQTMLVASGVLDARSRVAIVDPVWRTRCRPDQIGEIWIAGPSVAAGYWTRSEETAATFHACIADTGDGPWLRSGDLGFIRDGCLFVTGRIKDVLIVRGLKHYPQDLELTAERANPAVRSGGCAAFALDRAGEEHIALVAEIDARSAPDFAGIAGASLMQRSIDEIRRQIAEDHDVQLCSVTLVAAGSLPRTTSGKLQRFLCRRAFATGTLDVLGQWTARAGSVRLQPDDGVPASVNLERAAS
jgi:acyl-CoA synthetase (AMP-forming)/AMP-acid ligase II